MFSYALGAIALVLFLQWMIGDDETQPESRPDNPEDGDGSVRTIVQGQKGKESSPEVRG